MRLTLIPLLFLIIKNAEAARILGIGIAPSYSHQIVFEPIWRELSLRGHEVVLMSVNPLKDPNLVNLTEIDLSEAYEVKKTFLLEDALTGKLGFIEAFNVFIEFNLAVTNMQLEHPEVVNLLKSEDQKFDLVMMEVMSPAFAAFAHKFNCPLIGLFSLEFMPELYVDFGNPQNHVVHPHGMLPFYKDLNFFQRLASFTLDLFIQYYMIPITYARYDEIVQKYFGDDYPRVTELIKKFDMAFHNANPVLRRNKPVVPAIVEFGGGVHIRPPKPLPQEMKKFLDDSKEGAVYFSLGSNVISDVVSDELRKVFFSALEELPYKVLLKFEDGGIKVPKNAMLVKWAPQQDVLRHKNVKAFVSQCGCQSQEEALYSHVPLICIPFFGDQIHNALITVDVGIGLHLDKNTLTKEELKAAIIEAITNPKYKLKEEELDKMSKDQPMSGIDKVIWWTEYVIRHKGAKHLRSAVFDIPTYQYLCLDIYAFYATLCFVVVFVNYKIFKCILRLCFGRKSGDKKKRD